MQRDKVYMLDIIEATKLAVSYIENKWKEDFLNDVQCQDAVIRRLEIIGEAARRITDETQNTFPDLPWREMIGIRNILVHGLISDIPQKHDCPVIPFLADV